MYFQSLNAKKKKKTKLQENILKNRKKKNPHPAQDR